MKLYSSDLNDGHAIDTRLAFGRPDKANHMALSENRSPHLRWADVPDGARSFAVICVDPDVPSVADDVNQEGKTIPADLERVDFYHWVMIDVPANLRELETAECSRAVTPGGKKHPPGPEGSKQGLNNYTQFLAGDPEMAGKYFGYDGPCPPWNDERLHRYVFTVYALDTESLGLSGEFDGQDAMKAMEGHILGQASITGTYTLNPEVEH